MDKISGYKTYILAAATLAYAIGGVATKHLTPQQAIELVLASGSIASLRHAIEKK